MTIVNENRRIQHEKCILLFVVYKHILSDNSRNIPLLILLIRAFRHFVLPVPVFETFAPVVGHFLFRPLKLFVSRHETVGFSV